MTHPTAQPQTSSFGRWSLPVAWGNRADDVAVVPATRDLASFAPVVGRIRRPLRRRLAADTPWRLPSVTADAGELGRWWLAAGSLAGGGHLHRGQSGQDSYSFALTSDGAGLVVAVADGLGSRPETAQLGALVAARLLCHELAQHSTDMLFDVSSGSVHGAVHTVNRQLTEVCQRLDGRLSAQELATTVAACITAGDPGDPRRLFVRVGDCAAFMLRGDGFVPVFDRDGGPTNVVTAALPTDGGELPDGSVQTARVDEGAGAVVLTTDGVCEDIYDSPTVRAWLASRWSRPCEVMAFVDALRYRRQGSHDDRTALVVWPPQPASPAGPDGRQPTGEPARDRAAVRSLAPLQAATNRLRRRRARRRLGRFRRRGPRRE